MNRFSTFREKCDHTNRQTDRQTKNFKKGLNISTLKILASTALSICSIDRLVNYIKKNNRKQKDFFLISCLSVYLYGHIFL